MSTKKKILISIGITLVVGLAVVYLVILPTANDIKKIHQSVYLERVDLEKRYQRGMLLKEAVKNFEQAKPLEDKFNTIFILKDQELDFITTMEKVAVNNNLQQEINLQPSNTPNANSEYSTSNLSVILQGNFIDTLKYLQDLESLKYQVNIKSLTFTSNAKEATITTTLTGEVFNRNISNTQ